MHAPIISVTLFVVFASLVTEAASEDGIKIFCPPDKVIYSDEQMTRLNWDRVKYTKDPDAKYPPSIRSNIRSGSTVKVPGVYEIRYTARDRLGNVARCNFIVTVRRPSCKLPKVPTNGILVCDQEWEKTKKNMFCAIVCKRGFDVPKRGTVLRICNKKQWINYPMSGPSGQDCSVKGEGNLPKSLYYDGDITDSVVQEKVKSSYMEFMKKNTPFCYMMATACVGSRVEIFN